MILAYRSIVAFEAISVLETHGYGSSNDVRLCMHFYLV